MPGTKKVAFNIIKGGQNKIPEDGRVVYWKDFLKKSETAEAAYERSIDPKGGAVVLFSGGTTNMPKGILLSSYNFNALSSLIGPFAKFTKDDSVIAILPVFHGFGLGICIHTILCNGGTIFLEPKFGTKIYIDSLIKHQPTFIAGVPTMFEAMLRDKSFSKVRFDPPEGHLQRRRQFVSGAQGALRRTDQGAGQQGGARGGLRPYRDRDGLRTDAARPLPQGRDRHPHAGHACQDRGHADQGGAALR